LWAPTCRTTSRYAYIEGYVHTLDYDGTSGFTGDLVNQHMYEVEGVRPVLLHFNSRIEPDGTVESLVLEKDVPRGIGGKLCDPDASDNEDEKPARASGRRLPESGL
jgi:hypothetical protein